LAFPKLDIRVRLCDDLYILDRSHFNKTWQYVLKFYRSSAVLYSEGFFLSETHKIIIVCSCRNNTNKNSKSLCSQDRYCFICTNTRRRLSVDDNFVRVSAYRPSWSVRITWSYCKICIVKRFSMWKVILGTEASMKEIHR
jgi:hypothetical protein